MLKLKMPKQVLLEISSYVLVGQLQSGAFTLGEVHPVHSGPELPISHVVHLIGQS